MADQTKQTENPSEKAAAVKTTPQPPSTRPASAATKRLSKGLRKHLRRQKQAGAARPIIRR
jgi:hypothetical protein